MIRRQLKHGMFGAPTGVRKDKEEETAVKKDKALNEELNTRTHELEQLQDAFPFFHVADGHVRNHSQHMRAPYHKLNIARR